MKNSVTKICFLLLFTILLSNCKNTSTDPGGGSEPPTLDAVITYSPQNVATGTEVTLDATESQDAQNIGYDVEWSFSSKPSNSTATISSATSPMATFTPDEAGDYVVSLTIENDSEGISDSEQATLAAMDASQTEEISGTISSDRTLTDNNEDPEIPDYLVTGNLTVNAQLTAEPGVVMHFQEDVLMEITSDGTLIAEGAEADSIEFTTSNQPGGILWKGIFIRSSSALNSIKYAKISYAGNSTMNFVGSDFKAAVGIIEGGKVKIEHSRIYENDGYGIYADDNGGIIDFFANNELNNNTTGVGAPANTIHSIASDNTFSGNAEAAVEIAGSTFASGNEETWNALADNAAYRVTGDLDINGTLTVAPASNFVMDEDVLWTINGALIANGDQSTGITFTTSDPNNSLLWKGLFFKSADSRNELNYTTLSYAGNSDMNFTGTDFSTIVGVLENAKVGITNSTISNSKSYGLYVDDNGGELSNFVSNNFTDNVRAISLPANEADDMDSATTFSNNTEAQVEISGTTYSTGKASTWLPLNSSATYRVSGNVDIDGELTIAAGAQFRLDEDVLIEIKGSMSAEGTSGSMIVFSTSNSAGGLHWKGLFFQSSSALNKLEYVRVSDGGESTMNFVGDDFKAGVGVLENGKLSVLNSEISGNKGHGIYVDNNGGLLENFSDNTISKNEIGVGVPADEVDAIDSNTTFSNNNSADVLDIQHYAFEQ
jgi:hypothetical protein